MLPHGGCTRKQHANMSASSPSISIAMLLQMINGILLKIRHHSKGHPLSWIPGPFGRIPLVLSTERLNWILLKAYWILLNATCNNIQYNIQENLYNCFLKLNTHSLTLLTGALFQVVSWLLIQWGSHCDRTEYPNEVFMSLRKLY